MASSLTAPNKYQKCNQSFTRLASDLVHLHTAAWLPPVTGPGKEGMNQACGWENGGAPSYARPYTRSTYASDLKRAHSTAVQLVAPRTSLPGSDKDPLSFPPIHTTPLIREEHFGIAEGKLWFAGQVSKTKQQQQRQRASVHDDEKRLHREDEVYETIHN